MATFTFYGRVGNPYDYAFGGGVPLDVLEASSNRITLLNPYNFARIELEGARLENPQAPGAQYGSVSRILISDPDGTPIYSIAGSGNSWRLASLLDAIRSFQTDGDSRKLSAALTESWMNRFDASQSDRPLTLADTWLPSFSEGVLTPFKDTVRLGDFRDDLVATLALGQGDVAYASGGNRTITANSSNLIYPERGRVTVQGSPVVDFGFLDTGELYVPGKFDRLSFDRSGKIHEIIRDGTRMELRNAEKALQNGAITIDASYIRENVSIRVNAGEKIVLTALDHGVIQSFFLSDVSQERHGFVADLDLQGEGTITLHVGYTERKILNFDARATTSIVQNQTLMNIDIPAGTIQTSRHGYPVREPKITVGAGVTLEVIGTDFNDRLIGGEENDIFYPHMGNDTIDGGGGYDILRYAGHPLSLQEPDDRYLHYGPQKLVLDMGAGTATLTRDTLTYEQTFSNIEAVYGTPDDDLMFGNGKGVLLGGEDGNDRLYGDGFHVWHHLEESNQIYRLYQAVLGRTPDVEGHHDWTQSLALGTQSLQSIVQGFMGSLEFRTRYVGLTSEAFVELLYNNVLGRSSDPAGHASWVELLQNGAGRHNVVLGFVNSPEFRASIDGAANEFATRQDQTKSADDIYRLYKATLAREPDLDGLESWLAAMAKGITLENVAWGFVNSPEFMQTYGALGNAAFVNLLYQNVLDRAADAAGHAGWLAQLEGGASREAIVLGFSQSQEYIAKTRPQMTDWLHAQGTTTLEGGAGNDLLYSGLLADVFIFRAADKGTDVIRGLDDFDTLSFQGFGYDNLSDLRAHFTQQGDDIIFSDQGVTVVIEDTRLAALSDDMLMI